MISKDKYYKTVLYIKVLITVARGKNQSTIRKMNNTPQINWYAVPVRDGGVVEMNSRSQLCLERC